MSLGDPSYHGPPRRPGARPRRLRRLERSRALTRAVEAESAPPAASGSASPWRWTLAVRYVLPALVVLGGVVAMAFGTDTSLEGGAGLVGAGLAIWFLNWLFRIGAAGDAERDAEDRARDYFDRHGRWPEGR